MRKARTAKPHPHTIKQAINLIFDHKKRQDEPQRKKAPVYRYLGRLRANWDNYLDD
jgi:hypothetical protein